MIKSEIINWITEDTKEWVFPIIAKSNKSGVLVLFSEACKGTIIYDNKNDYGIGHHCECWVMDNFTKITPTQKIVLNNVITTRGNNNEK